MTTAAVFQMLSNDHGDIIALADASGEVFARYAYGPFGEDWGIEKRMTGSISATLAAEIAAASPLRYAGCCYDAWSGDYYLQARYYDPATKQFLSKDPAEADGEESAYQYCGGDPIHRIDPTGLWGWGGLGRAFQAAKRSVTRTASRAAAVLRSVSARVTRRAVTAVRHARTRVATTARAAGGWASGQTSRAKSRIAALRAGAERRAVAARRAQAAKRASAVAKGKAAAKRGGSAAKKRGTTVRTDILPRVMFGWNESQWREVTQFTDTGQELLIAAALAKPGYQYMGAGAIACAAGGVALVTLAIIGTVAVAPALITGGILLGGAAVLGWGAARVFEIETGFDVPGA